MKATNPIGSELLASTPIEQVIVLDNTKLSFVGPEGAIVQIDLKDVLLNILSQSLTTTYDNQTSIPTGDGTPVRINPATPKMGDLNIVRPVLGVTGGVMSGAYQVFIYLQSGWQQIFP